MYKVIDSSFNSALLMVKPCERRIKQKCFQKSVRWTESNPDLSVVLSSTTLQGRLGWYAGNRPKNKTDSKRQVRGHSSSVWLPSDCSCEKHQTWNGEMADGSADLSRNADNPQLRTDSQSQETRLLSRVTLVWDNETKRRVPLLH